MRRALRVLAVVGVWAGASFFGPSAQAHHVISFHACSDAEPSPTPTGSPSASPTPTPGPQACVPAEGSKLTGVVNLSFEVVADSARPIKRVDLFILSEEDGIPSPNDRAPVDSWSFAQDDRVARQTFRYTWDTTALTPYNGRYKVQVVASTYNSSHPSQGSSPACTQDRCVAERRDLRVDNQPMTPAAPRIVAKTGTTVSVEWDKAPEPDVLSYQLYRTKTSSPEKVPVLAEFKEVASVSTLSVRDEVKSEGVYWYVLIVTRRSVVTPEQGVRSAPSPISKAAEVKVVDEDDDGPGGGGAPAPTFQPRVVSRLPRLTVGSGALRPPPVPDAPFSAVLPYDLPEGAEEVPAEDPGVGEPRGPVLPVAVGAFLVSSALALGRMPY
ncbi:MAG: hypothetical protein ACRDKJ_14405 [Actinomycetota bacterium]